MSHQSNDIIDRIKNATAKAEAEHKAEAERAKLAANEEERRRKEARQAISTTIVPEIERVAPALKFSDWDRSEWAEDIEKNVKGRKEGPIRILNFATLWFRSPLDARGDVFAPTYLLMVAMPPDERRVFLIGGWCRMRPKPNERRAPQHKLELIHAHEWRIDELTPEAAKAAVADLLVRLIPAFGTN